MEHHEVLNKLKDTEDALFRECEKAVKLEQALAEKDKEIERLREVHADEKVAWKAKHNAEMTVIEQQCERYRVALQKAHEASDFKTAIKITGEALNNGRD